MDTYIVAGLGNPGLRYCRTRHNIGFLVLDYISKQLNIRVNKLAFKSKVAYTEINGKKVILMKPQTYMNSSGIAIFECAQYHDVPPENIIVICDDISLPANKIRIRRKGSSGGHNGLKSIINMMDSDEFPRIRVGISDRENESELKDWVLGKLTKDYLDEFEKQLPLLYTAVTDIIGGNIEKAMADLN